MSGPDGLGGIARLRGERPHLPLILSAGAENATFVAEAIKLGVMDYLPRGGIGEACIRRTIETAVERAAKERKLAEQRDALENFARVLVHDLKGPLSAIIGFAALNEAALKQPGYDPENAIKGSQRVMRAARNMQRIIETVRQYTQLDAEVEFASVSMQGVVEDVLGDMEATIRARQATILCGPLPPVHGNAPQLAQLMQNLIGNAIKYCDAERPTVRIQARPQVGGGWLFEVRDNGIGVPEHERERIFEPFKRMANAARFEGTGLGLAICRKVIERHGGAIWLKSREGEGASFYFTLPAALAVEAHAPAEAPRLRYSA
jgi:signal transduction histidine kinase